MKQGKGNIIEQRKRRIKRNKSFILEIKRNKSCELCGYKEHAEILHFHHKDINEKKFEMNNASSGYSIKTIQKEIDKCMILCPNCHAWIHYSKFFLI